jgi:hypothetical protein
MCRSYLIIGFCPEFNGFDLLENFFCFFGIVPEIRVMRGFFLLFDQV